MLRKIKQWWQRRKLRGTATGVSPRKTEMYTREQMEKVWQLGYNDGKRDGLAIARQQATNSLKEILWQQNNQSQK